MPRSLRATILLASLLMAGCAGRPHGILIPIAETVPGAGRVDMLVATTRGLDKEDPAEMFNGDRSLAASYAALTVSIPPDGSRRIGEVQWPKSVPGDPAKDFVTLRADIIGQAEAFRELDAAARRAPHRQVLVFVHGYNNKFKDAAFRFAQIMHNSGTTATPILFTWPSRGRLLDYGYDRDSTTFSRDELERFLRALARDPNVGEITIMAHSMGNWLTLEALRQMAIRDGRVLPKIANVVMAAPDVDVDVFQTQIRTIGTRAPKFTMFVSQDDEALAVSRRLAGNAPRLGAINPDKAPYKADLEADRITVVDLTKIRGTDDIHHMKFAQSPEVVQLLGQRLATGQSINEPDEENGLGQLASGAVSKAGSAARLAVAAPLSVFDPQERENLGDRAREIGGD